MAAQEAYLQAVDQFSDWRWRLNNLYYITDKKGRKVKFVMNGAQERFFNSMHYMNVILKARQLGFTTFLQIFMLDACVFNSNVKAGTIAHTLIDAQNIFKTKVKFPYDNLPQGIRDFVWRTANSGTELALSNNSTLRVGMSLRGGTLNYLHITEYGKLCAKFPDKAEEVRTGALNTLQVGQVGFIESTAEGQEGHYYDICEQARAKARAGTKLTPLDFKFHFEPWWVDPQYQLGNDPDLPVEVDEVIIPAQYAKYFADLAEKGIDLSSAQRAWYVKKAETQLDKMKREYPSTPDEAFESAIEGAYYANEMAAADLDGRIGQFAAHKDVPVNTAWDIGYGDYTTIWLFQRVGMTIRLVGYIQKSGEGLYWYLRELVRLAEENGWRYGKHLWPHDGKVHEWGSGRSRIEQAWNNPVMKFKPEIVPLMEIDDGIAAARITLPNCEFDAAGCAEGLKALRSYRKEWDEERAVWRERPRHDWASHGADGFRTMACRWRDIDPAPVTPLPIRGTAEMTLDEAWKYASPKKTELNGRI